MFTLTEKHLSKLCEQNSFKIDSNVMVFFGLRGCLPVDDADHSFRSEHKLEQAEINHINPRCTLIQWRPDKGEFAVFPGSTVPSRKYIGPSLDKGGAGANQMMTGYYKDYRKGKHKPGKPTSHDAFRETSARPIRRSAAEPDMELAVPTPMAPALAVTLTSPAAPAIALTAAGAPPSAHST